MKYLSDREIDIELNPGIYVFDNESATGKTFLYKMLTGLHSHPEVLCVTYDTVDLITDFEGLLNKRQVKLVLLDRYDMYAGRFDDVILKYKDDIVFILDYKNGYTLNKYAKICYIELTRDRLEVIDCDSV